MRLKGLISQLRKCEILDHNCNEQQKQFLINNICSCDNNFKNGVNPAEHIPVFSIIIIILARVVANIVYQHHLVSNRFRYFVMLSTHQYDMIIVLRFFISNYNSLQTILMVTCRIFMCTQCFNRYFSIGVPSIGAWGGPGPPVFLKFAGGPPQFLKNLQTGPPV